MDTEPLEIVLKKDATNAKMIMHIMGVALYFKSLFNWTPDTLLEYSAQIRVLQKAMLAERFPKTILPCELHKTTF